MLGLVSLRFFRKWNGIGIGVWRAYDFAFLFKCICACGIDIAGKGDILLNAVSPNLSRRYCSSFSTFSSSGG